MAAGTGVAAISRTAGYLDRFDALLRYPTDHLGRATRIQRLARMNPLSMRPCRRYKANMTRAPRQFNINNQHVTGSLAVNTWGGSSLENCYAISQTAAQAGSPGDES